MAWTNWSGCQQNNKAELKEPKNLDELKAIVSQAKSAQKTIAVVGAGHSFGNLFSADILISLGRFNRLVSVNSDNKQITCEAGMRLEHFYGHLEASNLSLATFPTGFESTLGGIVSTPTHGAGFNHPILAEQMVSCVLLTADGEIKTITDQDPEIHAVRSGLGMLGIVLKITMQCEAAFVMRRRTIVEHQDEAFAKYAERDQENASQQLFWLPGCDQVLISLIDRVDDEPDLSFTDCNNLEFQKAMHTKVAWTLRFPQMTHLINRKLARFFSESDVVVQAPRGFVDYATEKLINAEWAIPYANIGEVYADMTERMKGGQAFQGLVEFRSIAADDSLLSMAYQRQSIAVGNSIFGDFKTPHKALRKFSEMMQSHDARPHWAKACTVNRRLDSLFPGMKAFKEVRKKWDPSGVFVSVI